MTTIFAYRDAMYADSGVSDEGLVFPAAKLFRVGDAIIGTSGESCLTRVFMEQLGRGVFDPPDPPKSRDCWDFSALVLTPEGLWHYGPYFDGDQVLGIYHAIGSGGSSALAALHALRARCEGVNPILCVECAIKVDSYSHGPVQWMRLGEYVLHREGA